MMLMKAGFWFLTIAATLEAVLAIHWKIMMQIPVRIEFCIMKAVFTVPGRYIRLLILKPPGM